MTLPKSGPGSKRNTRRPLSSSASSVRTGDVRGHEVRRELDAAEAEAQRAGERPDEEGLAQPRRALEEGVPAGEEDGENLVEDFLAAHHDGTDGRLQALQALPEDAEAALDLAHGRFRWI
jgi:flagellar biosynthesis/type III secretory pathway protein FliH